MFPCEKQKPRKPRKPRNLENQENKEKQKKNKKKQKTHDVIYFWKGNRTRTSKTMFPRVWHPNTQIQIHKCTQIHKYSFGQIMR